MSRRLLAIAATPLSLLSPAPLLVGCAAQSTEIAVSATHALPSISSEASAPGQLSVSVSWPARHAQAIPWRTERIRLRVLKGAVMRAELPLSRPGDTGVPLRSSANLRIPAEAGLTVEALAFPATGSVPLAWGYAYGVSVIANQRTDVQLKLTPAFTPTLLGTSPLNGGPGTPVTLTGAFGDSGYYGIGIGQALAGGGLSAGKLIALVPSGAQSSPMVAYADGVASAPGETFRVLISLELAPSSATTSLGAPIAFAVPTARDTQGETVTSPTLTRWEIVDPQRLMDPFGITSLVGSIDQNGLFTPSATGAAWVRVSSGYLTATASIQVE